MKSLRDRVKNLVLRHIKQHPWFYRFLRYGIYARVQSANRKRVFKKAYDDNLWGSKCSASGPGSSLDATESLRNSLPSILKSIGARSILDIPCGDFQWMKSVPLGIEEYIGADIVHALIEKNHKDFGHRGLTFVQLDLLSDPLPTTDVMFCRDCMVHLSFHDINRALANIRRAKPRYVLLTTFPHHQWNEDTVTPYWRALNLQIQPFNFPKPLTLIKDFSDSQGFDQGKCLGIWRADSLGVGK